MYNERQLPFNLELIYPSIIKLLFLKLHLFSNLTDCLRRNERLVSQFPKLVNPIMWCKRTQLIKSFGSSWPRFIIGPLNGSSLNHFISYVKVRRLLGNEKVISLKLTIIFCNLLHNFFLVKSINRKFNRNHLKGAKNWIRQVENLTDRYDYTLLMECSENYVCEVCNLKSNKNNSYFT